MNKNKVEEFNQSRIPFAVVNGKLMFTMFDKREHKDWLREVYGVSKEEFEKLILGYMKDGNIYFYRTSKFKPVKLETLGIDVLNHLHILSMCYMNTSNPSCFNGMHVDSTGRPSVPLDNLGDMKELLSRRYRSSGITEYSLATAF